MPETTVNVRYMVDDVQAAVAWYTKHLGFSVLSNHAPAFADVRRGASATAAAERPLELSGTADAGRRTSFAGRLEPDPPCGE